MSCRCSWARSNISAQHTLQTHNLKVRRTHTSMYFFLCTRRNLSVLMRRGNCDGLRDWKSLMSQVYLSEEPKWTQDDTDEIIAGDLPSVWSEQRNWKAAFHQLFSTLQRLHCTKPEMFFLSCLHERYRCPAFIYHTCTVLLILDHTL